MKRFQEQFASKANRVSLTKAERDDVRERLQAFMEYHPLPAATAKTKTSRAVITEPFTMVQVPFAMLGKALGAAFMIVVLIVPFMAERTVPGDTLYAVKVQFNEEVRSTLTFDSYQKVAWETERLNRRIAEARLLANEGRLTEEVEAEVAAAVKEHSESAKREIEQMRTVDADDATIAAIELDTTLETQASTFATAATSSRASSSARETNLIAAAIVESRSQAEASTSAPSVDKLLARIEQNTTRIVELRETVAAAASAERLEEVDRRITDLERNLTEAVAMIEEDEAAARTTLIEVLQRSQKIIVFMTELEVVDTVDIDTVVPIVLTDEEKAAKQAELETSLVDKRAAIVNALAIETDTAITEKADAALSDIDASLEAMASSTAHLAFVEYAAAAIALADDTLRLLEKEPVVRPDAPASASSSATSTASTTKETASTSVASSTQSTTTVDTEA